jgi:hypothetical protein
MQKALAVSGQGFPCNQLREGGKKLTTLGGAAITLMRKVGS